MKPSIRLSIVLILFAAAIAAFVFLDFHVAKSITDTSFTQVVANSAIPEGYQPGNGMLYIAPADDLVLSRALAKAVFQQAGSSGYFSPVLLQKLPHGDQFPAVIVSAAGENFFWTPFYSQSNLRIKLAFSNYRAITTINSQADVILPAQDGTPAIEGDSDVAQMDKSFGLISLPGYRSLILQSAAKTVVGNLEEMIKPR